MKFANKAGFLLFFSNRIYLWNVLFYLNKSNSFQIHSFFFQVYADATLVFPLLVAQTFAADFHKRKSNHWIFKVLYLLKNLWIIINMFVFYFQCWNINYFKCFLENQNSLQNRAWLLNATIYTIYWFSFNNFWTITFILKKLHQNKMDKICSNVKNEYLFC